MLTRSRKAFTLLELIVVIVILGILAALAIPTFQAVIDRAKQANVTTSAQSLAREIDALAAFDSQAPTAANASAATADGSGTGMTYTVTASNVNVAKDGKAACVTLSTVAGHSSTVAGTAC